MNEDGREIRCQAPFSLLQQHECSLVDPSPQELEEELVALQKLRKEHRKGVPIKQHHEEKKERPEIPPKRPDLKLMDIDESPNDIPNSKEIKPDKVRIFEGHAQEVFLYFNYRFILN